MLKKIKDFFQSIAGRIASIWNSIKNWCSGNKVNQVIDPNKKIMLNVKKLDNGKVVLAIPQGIDLTLPNNKDGYGNVINNEFRLDFNDESLYITGRYDSKTMMEDGNICLSINSVGTLDSNEVYGDNKPEEMEKLLLDSANTNKIRRQVGQSLSNTPNSETTNTEAEQHIAGTGRSVKI
ncbi:hypothetical protein [Wolbachia endosymbiont (group B) of Germaria angustata]|uniref:hypothetical protein n=1 Tax=Wolbachia endosymbiont (group B) of Germaria angustata TaxID=3077916 RepID=UPI0031331E54